MEDKIYPAFYKDVDDFIYLYVDNKNYYCLSNGKWEGVDYADEKDHEADKNITLKLKKIVSANLFIGKANT